MTRLRILKSSLMFNNGPLHWFPIFLIILLFGVACGTKSPSIDPEETVMKMVSPSVEARFDEVRAIHDEIMPTKIDLVRLQREVSSAEIDASVSAFAKTRLERADDMMMHWMYNEISLTKLADSLSENEIMNYLDEREVEIKSVGDSMNTAINFAKLALAQ